MCVCMRWDVAWDGLQWPLCYADPSFEPCCFLPHPPSLTHLPLLPSLLSSLFPLFFSKHLWQRPCSWPFCFETFSLHSLCFVRSKDGFVDLVLPDSAERQLNLLLMIAELCASRACVIFIYTFLWSLLYIFFIVFIFCLSHSLFSICDPLNFGMIIPFAFSFILICFWT